MPDGDVAVQSFPFNVPGMLVGLFLAGLGAFLVGSITSGRGDPFCWVYPLPGPV